MNVVSPARAAFEKRDVSQAMRAHKAAAAGEDHAGSHSDHIKSFVYGGLDGIATTFAVIAGVAGGGYSGREALIIGFAKLVADGLAMGLGDYISSVAENNLSNYYFFFFFFFLNNINN
jgi:hypothetical protein